MLAIDDSRTALELISTVLSSKGHEVETATSGEEGLAKYIRFRPDIVTLDLAMPAMDGYETLASLKRLDKYANVLMLTAANHSSALQRCLQEGAIDFISKPFSASDILNAIDRTMESAKYCNHDAAAFFSQLNIKLQHAVRTAFSFGSSSSSSLSHLPSFSIKLKKVQTVRNLSDIQGKYGNAQELDYMPSKDHACFVTRMVGEKDGMVISLIKNRDLPLLFDTPDVLYDRGKAPDNVMEFFNMINMKVISELADSTHSKVDGRPVMFFSNLGRMSSLWSETARMWNRIELAVFDMSHAGSNNNNNDNKVIPLTLQLWCDGELFAR